MSDKFEAPPKKPVNAFAYFVEARSAELKAQGIKSNEIFKTCGNEWKTLDEAGKQKYKDMFENAMSTYVSSANEWEEKNGISVSTYNKNHKTKKSKTAAPAPSVTNNFVQIAVPQALAECVQSLISAYLSE